MKLLTRLRALLSRRRRRPSDAEVNALVADASALARALVTEELFSGSRCAPLTPVEAVRHARAAGFLATWVVTLVDALALETGENPDVLWQRMAADLAACDEEALG